MKNTGAGYSGTPLQAKLGIKANMRGWTCAAPREYKEWIGDLPEGTRITSAAPAGPVAFIHIFVKGQKSFETQFVECRKLLAKDGMLWVSWPKKTSGVKTDLTENTIRGFGLENGLVDVKVCAVSDVWSGLKFVFRLKDR